MTTTSRLSQYTSMAAVAAPEATPASELRIRVLDDVSIAAGDCPPVAVGSLQQRTFLTLLVAAKGRTVSLDAIADEVWAQRRPRRWRGCLATLASSLRKNVGDSDFILSTARGYTLHRRPDVVHTDVEELHNQLEQARQAERQGLSDEAETLARAALATYGTGPWTSDYWGWNEAAADAARILGTALLRRGAYVSCIAELARAMEEFEWHDRLWACLIYAYHQLGSTRRALELAEKATTAVGMVTPILAEVGQEISTAPSLDAPFLWAQSA